MMTSLNFTPETGGEGYFVLAHDRGARVAHKLMVDFPNEVRKAVFLDIAPTLCMFEATNQEFATAYWHWFFLIQKAPLPEMMITSMPRRFAELFMGGRFENGYKTFNEEVFEKYVQSLGDEETVHAMCEDYRAAATLDLEEAREDIKNGRKIKGDIKVVWGKRGVIEKCFDAVSEWEFVSDGKVEGKTLDCGHYIPEEKPEEVARIVEEFLKE